MARKKVTEEKKTEAKKSEEVKSVGEVPNKLRYEIHVTSMMTQYNNVSTLFFSYVYGKLVEASKTGGRYDVLDNADVRDKFIDIFDNITKLMNVIFCSYKDTVDINRLKELYNMFMFRDYMQKLSDISKEHFGIDLKDMHLFHPELYDKGNDYVVINEYIKPFIGSVVVELKK